MFTQCCTNCVCMCVHERHTETEIENYAHLIIHKGYTVISLSIIDNQNIETHISYNISPASFKMLKVQ